MLACEFMNCMQKQHTAKLHRRKSPMLRSTVPPLSPGLSMPSPRGPSLQRHAVEEDIQGPRAVCDAWQAITFTNNQDSPFLLICFSFDLTSKVPTFEKTSYLWNLALPAGRQITNSREELPLHTVVLLCCYPCCV